MSRSASCSGVKSRSIYVWPPVAPTGHGWPVRVGDDVRASGAEPAWPVGGEKMEGAAGRGERIMSRLPAVAAAGPGVVVRGGGKGDAGDALSGDAVADF